MKTLLQIFFALFICSPIAVAQNVGIGTTAPQATLHVVSSSAGTASFDGPEQMYIILREAGFYRGYIGSYSGATADVDFGTGIGNVTGQTHLTIQGQPKLTVDPQGNTSLAGELNTPSKTGAANMVPICYGNVGSAGGIQTGTGNFSVTRLLTGWYVITITGESYQFQTFVTIVTASGSATPCFFTTGSGGGNLHVYSFNAAGVATDNSFQFVVYKP